MGSTASLSFFEVVFFFSMLAYGLRVVADSACGPVAHCKVTNFRGQKRCTYRLKNANDQIFSSCTELSGAGRVLLVHSKITFSIARNVIMIGLLSKRGDVERTSPRCLLWPFQTYSKLISGSLHLSGSQAPPSSALPHTVRRPIPQEQLLSLRVLEPLPLDVLSVRFRDR